MDSEKTVMHDKDADETRFEHDDSGNRNHPISHTGNWGKDASPTESGIWKRASITAAGGVLIGSASSMLMGMNSGEPDAKVNNETTDGEIEVIPSAEQDMSFNEAFASARAELGPGSYFEWHGNVYSTCTAEEWNEMGRHQQEDLSQTDETDSWQDTDDDVEILGVSSENNQFLAETDIAIDGDDAILIDMHENMTMDYIAQDIDVQAPDLLASNDEPDLFNDTLYDV